jgi:hypothetical protein
MMVVVCDDGSDVWSVMMAMTAACSWALALG